ncbi:putative myb dna-binding domain protein [Phaeomoniella chlamydospora]|uniref:Putative myb dna-binding domain protein n=1 Tax=Phaeomoniella chlamydospora TaxID=158046 RepID=A0A0G2DVT3_PHACM|nr:putative myb dna-binding domain protein [Phaeomoniella chlamydospora]
MAQQSNAFRTSAEYIRGTSSPDVRPVPPGSFHFKRTRRLIDAVESDGEDDDVPRRRSTLTEFTSPTEHMAYSRHESVDIGLGNTAEARRPKMHEIFNSQFVRQNDEHDDAICPVAEDEYRRDPSVELGEPVSTAAAPEAQEHPDISVVTSVSSIFDPPESRADTPIPAPSELSMANQRRKRTHGDAFTNLNAENLETLEDSRTGTPTTSVNSLRRADLLSPRRSSSVKRRKTGSQHSTLRPRNQDPQRTYRSRSTPQAVDPDRDDEDEDVANATLLSESGIGTRHGQPLLSLKCSVCDRQMRNTGTLLRHERAHDAAEERRLYDPRQRKGAFSVEEINRLDEFQAEFCTAYHISIARFNELINWPKSMEPHWPTDLGFDKEMLMNRLYETLPERTTRSLRRFKERHFRNVTETSKRWTDEQDEELFHMVRERGHKFVEIATELGRTQNDVSQRYYNHVKNRGSQGSGSWTEEELQSLCDAVAECKRRLRLSESPHTDDQIKWEIVSEIMGNIRSRAQCSKRWRKDRSINERVRNVRGELERERSLRRAMSADYSSSSTRTSQTATTPPSTAKRRTRGRQKAGAKSDMFVRESSLDDDDEVSDEAGAQDEGIVDHGAIVDDNEREEDAVRSQINDDSIEERNNAAVDDEMGIESHKDAMGINPAAAVSPSLRATSPEPVRTSQRPQKQATSSNPFNNSKTPLKNLTQLFDGTQANSSDTRINKHKDVVEDTPVQPPPRPSPDFATQHGPETPATMQKLPVAEPIEVDADEEEDHVSVASSEAKDQDGEDDEEDNSELLSRLALKEIPTRSDEGDDGLDSGDDEQEDDDDLQQTAIFSSRDYRDDSSDDEQDQKDSDHEVRDEGEDEVGSSRFSIYEDESANVNNQAPCQQTLATSNEGAESRSEIEDEAGDLQSARPILQVPRSSQPTKSNFQSDANQVEEESISEEGSVDSSISEEGSDKVEDGEDNENTIMVRTPTPPTVSSREESPSAATSVSTTSGVTSASAAVTESEDGSASNDRSGSESSSSGDQQEVPAATPSSSWLHRLSETAARFGLKRNGHSAIVKDEKEDSD